MRPVASAVSVKLHGVVLMRKLPRLRVENRKMYTQTKTTAPSAREIADAVVVVRQRERLLVGVHVGREVVGDRPGGELLQDLRLVEELRGSDRARRPGSVGAPAPSRGS